MEMVKLADGAVLWTESEVTDGMPGAVFVHGGPGLWDYLAPVAEPLADLVSSHRYDQRGCGRSSPDDRYRLDRFVADLEELREHFGYEPGPWPAGKRSGPLRSISPATAQT